MKLSKDGNHSLRSLQLYMIYGVSKEAVLLQVWEAPAMSHRQLLYVIDILYTLSLDWQAAGLYRMSSLQE